MQSILYLKSFNSLCKILCKRKIPRNHAWWFWHWDKGNCLNANGISQMFLTTSLTEHKGGFLDGIGYIIDTNPSEKQTGEDFLQGNISKEEWLQKEFSPLSSSLPVWQQAKSMARRRTHQRQTHQRRTLQRRTLQRRTLQQRHIANASTPSLRPNQTRHTGDWKKYKQLNYCFVADKCMQRLQKSLSTFSSVTNSEEKFHPGETRTPCVDPRGLGFATSTATLTVATTSLLPVLQGCFLIWLTYFFKKCNDIIWNRFMFIFTFFYICLYIQVQVFPSLWRLQWHRMGVK